MEHTPQKFGRFRQKISRKGGYREVSEMLCQEHAFHYNKLAREATRLKAWQRLLLFDPPEGSMGDSYV